MLERCDGIADTTWSILTNEPHARRYGWVLARAQDPVLDAGCGQGYLSCLMRKRGLNVVAVDLHPGLVATAKRLQIANAVGFPAHVGSLYALDMPSDTFSTAVCSEVLEHLDDPGLAVRELARVARHVLLTVPAYGAMRIPGHIHDFDKATLEALVQQAGLRVTHYAVDHPWQYVEAIRP
jgi:SAM-dependent methyltransferase